MSRAAIIKERQMHALIDLKVVCEMQTEAPKQHGLQFRRHGVIR